MAFLFIDLDHFKPINDQYGHKTGDVVLCEIAKRLSETIRTEDFLARIGGDEFIIMIWPLSDDGYLDKLANRILESCAAPVIVGKKSFALSASIGISKNENHRLNGNELVHKADSEMYLAKKAGGNCYAINGVIMNKSSL